MSRLERIRGGLPTEPLAWRCTSVECPAEDERSVVSPGTGHIGSARTISFATALWLFGWDLVESADYPSAWRAKIDDAWERPAASRSEHPLWDRDAEWLTHLRAGCVPWANEVLALPYLYLALSSRRPPRPATTIR
jgi:hypothetical protein